MKIYSIELYSKRGDLTIPAVQFDTDRTVRFEVVDEQFQDGAEVKLYVKKPSGEETYTDYEVLDNGVEVKFTQQTLSETGKRIPAQLQFNRAAKKTITTYEFYLDVSRNLASGNAVESKSEYQTLDKYIEQVVKPDVNQAAVAAKTSAVQAIRAESTKQQNAIASKGTDTLATIPDDYISMYNQVQDHVSDIIRLDAVKASGITGQAHGSDITVEDSAAAPLQAITIYGRTDQVKTTGAQLLRNDDYKWTNNGGTVNVLPTGVNYKNDAEKAFGSVCYQFELEPNTEYTLRTDATVYAGCAVLGIRVSNDGGNTYPNTLNFQSNSIQAAEIVKTGEMIVHFSLESDTHIRVYLHGSMDTPEKSNVYFENLILKKKASNILYEPYTGGKPSPSPENPGNLESVGNGNYIRAYESRTESGITYTLNEDGSITVSGTATADANLTSISLETGRLIHLLKGTYYLSGSAGGVEVYLLSKDVNVVGAKDTGAGALLIVAEDIDCYLQLKVLSGAAINTTIYPMLNRGYKALPYMPYSSGQGNIFLQNKEENIIIASDGLPGIPFPAGSPYANYIDDNGQHWLCDTIEYNADGTGEYVQRVKKDVLDGESYIGASIESLSVFYSRNNDGIADSLSVQYALCKNYNYTTENNKNMPDKSFKSSNISSNVSGSYYFIRDTAYSTVDQFKVALAANPITILSGLAEPIRTPLTADQLTELRKLRTYHSHTSISNSDGADMDVKYLVDTKTYIDRKIQEIVNQMQQ